MKRLLCKLLLLGIVLCGVILGASFAIEFLMGGSAAKGCFHEGRYFLGTDESAMAVEVSSLAWGVNSTAAFLTTLLLRVVVGGILGIAVSITILRLRGRLSYLDGAGRTIEEAKRMRDEKLSWTMDQKREF